MTGAYIQFERDGKHESVEIEHLTEAERRKFFTTGDLELRLRCVEILCRTIRHAELLLHRPEPFRESPLSE